MEAQKGDDTDDKLKLDDYEVIEQLWKGTFGTSFLVLHRTDKKKYVLKKIPLAKQTEKAKRNAHQEMDLIAKLSHPYILEYKDIWMDKGSCIWIVTNYCEDGDMAEIIRKSEGALFPEEKLCKWLTQLLLALEYLHSKRVHHRDLKLCNVFITKDNDIRLGDFGLAKFLDAVGVASSVAGAHNNMCPELLAGIPYGYKSDIWSLGCCLFEIAAHQPPFRAPDMTQLINKINRGSLSPLPIIYSSTLKQITKSMVRKNPEHRPTAAELLRHQHLQPYLLLCHNPSPVFLPVRSPSGTKEKTRPSPGKSSSPKDSRDRRIKLKGKSPVLYFDESDNVQPRNLSENFNVFKTKLETKRVDPTSYSVKSSQDSEGSKSGEIREPAACNRYDQPETPSPKESTTPNSSRLTTNTQSKEKGHASLENVQQFEKSDRENYKIKDVEGLSSPVDSEEANKIEMECISEKPSRMTSLSEISSCKTRCFDEESTSSNSQPAAKPDTEAEPRFYAAETENGSECREVAIDFMSTESNELFLHKDAIETKAAMVNVTTQAEKDALQALDDKVSLLKELAALASENPTQQRAEALESLLELCAQLLKQKKINELAGVLKPFGDDGMSSRETAIWLTKSLMTAQKLTKGS